MRKTTVILGGIVLLGAILFAVIYFVPGRRAKLPGITESPQAPSARIGARMADEDADLPPVPYVSIQINSSGELETFAGVPLLLTVRLSNPRAMNAAAENSAREQLIREIESAVAEGRLTAEQAQAGLAKSRRKKEIRPLQWGDASRGWNEYVQLATIASDGKTSPLAWPAAPLAPPAAAGISLDDRKTAELKYAIDPAASSGIAPGGYQLAALLVVPDTGAPAAERWRGQAISAPIKLKISPMPSSPDAAQAERINLDFARFYMASGDLTKALDHAQKSLAANSESLAALSLSGEIKETQGDDAGAMAAYQSALGAFRRQHPTAYEPPLPLLDAIKRLVEKQTDPSVMNQLVKAMRKSPGIAQGALSAATS